MSELKITEGSRGREIIATGTMRLAAGAPPLTFSYGGASITVPFYLTERPREHNGTLIGTLPPGALTPGSDTYREIGEAEVRLQLEPVPHNPRDPRGQAFVLFYEVTIPAEPVTTLRRAA